MKKAFKFTMVPEDVHPVTQYLILDDIALEEEIDEHADDFFIELDNGRHPGYVLAEWQEVDVDEAEANHPYTLLQIRERFQMELIEESELQWYIDQIDRGRKIQEELEQRIRLLEREIKVLKDKAKGDALYNEDGFEIGW